MLRKLFPSKDVALEPAYSPLSYLQFTAYFLAPYVAAALIADDKMVTFQAAYDILLESQDFGDVMQEMMEGDDEELDDTTNRVLITMKIKVGLVNIIMAYTESP